MKNFDINNFSYTVKCGDGFGDAKLSFERSKNALSVSVAAEKSRPEFIVLKWAFKTDGEPYVYGDTWERSYGRLCFKKLGEKERYMPWYFAADYGDETFCFGVKTQAKSFVSFTYDESGVTAEIDCRNGATGVLLGGREVELCTFVFRHYSLPAFESLCEYCKELCEKPLIPPYKIYGGNNWYYAYGESSYEEIVRDAKLQAELSKGIENRPFMVIDDGWQPVSCSGPYYPNEKFRDMKKLAEDIKELGVRPGIWMRLLNNEDEEITDDMRILRDGERKYLDPTVKKTQEYIVKDIERVKAWGYELLKHDFTTYDLFGQFPGELSKRITKAESWHFRDETKTNAEIVLDLYRLIKDTCGDMLIIGCNTVSHLCAGLVQINRTGDDTSGRDWERTRKMGVNTLAFRLAQNNAFYVVDADCVGLMNNIVPWKKNRQWLDVLSKSDTALFTACPSLTEEEFCDIRKAYLEIQKEHKLKPIDIYDNYTPSKWECDNELIEYNWR